MSHILVSVLGKAPQQKNGAINYHPAQYDFGDQISEPARFFGLELCKKKRPDRLVILGTQGSMWDNLLLENPLNDQHDEALLALNQAATENRVDQAMLDELAGPTSAALGLPCTLQLIPYGLSEEEQTEILRILLEQFAPGDKATLDVTHGLRHLPMLVQQCTQVLQVKHGVTIEGVYYGALDMTDPSTEHTPVMNLSGLQTIDQWATALTVFDKTGDYGVFAPLLRQAGLSKALTEKLEAAAFFEQTHNTGQARGKLRQFLAELEQTQSDCQAYARLFLPALIERISWVKEDRLYQRQARVAWQALEHGDYLRATLYGFEALITQLAQQASFNPDNYEQRQLAREHFEKNPSNATRLKDYRLLRDTRNTLAHSNNANNKAVIKVLHSRQTLEAEIQRLFTVLIPSQ